MRCYSQCPYLEQPIFTHPYPEVEGNFYLRTNISYIYTEGNSPWLTTSEASESIEITANLLNEAYNPHGIYFVNMQENCDFGSMPKIEEVGSLQQPDIEELVEENAINIFVYTPIDIIYGWTYQSPNTFFYIEGNENGVWASETNAIVHEVGHLFGLLHPHHDCDICTGTTDCYCTYDLVCDTEPVSGAGNYGCNDEISSNYMSYPTSWSCADHFTPEQVSRMRTYLANASILQNTLVEDITIDSPSDTLPSTCGNITITSGTDYVIDGTEIQMLPGTSITVEDSASLEIKNGAKLSGACGKMWEGIIVEGDLFSGQSSSKQGKVVVRGSSTIIEHAKYGIRTKPNSGGGIIQVLGAVLKDNEVGVQFSQYTADFSESEFLFATFKTTEDYRSSLAPTHLDIRPMYGLDIVSTDFLDERSNCSSYTNKPNGIVASNSSFEARGCTFKNLNRGIVFIETGETPSILDVRNCSFEACRTGILTNGSSSFNINNNDFDLTPPDSCTVYEVVGVHLKGATSGFTLENNDFFNSSTNINDLEYFSIGTLCEGTHDGIDNKIKSNSFSTVHIGNKAVGDNGTEGVGMAFLCNDYEDFATPNDTLAGSTAPVFIWIAPGSSVREPQSDIDLFDFTTLPTGNIFNDLGSFAVVNQNADSIEYVYHLGASNQNPDGSAVIGSIGVIPVDEPDPNVNCTTSPPCNPCSENEINLLANVFYQHKTNWQTVDSILDTLTDKNLQKILSDSLYRLRRLMDRGAAFIINHYKSDTTDVHTDSVLLWLERLDSYPADYRRAKHFFFNQDTSRFNQLWPGLDETYDLSEDRLDEYDALAEVFDSLQLEFSDGNSVYELSKHIIDFLENQVSRCDEAGYLAQAVLWKNGIWAEANCSSPPASISKRPQPPLERKALPLQNLKVYPNPASQAIQLEYPGFFELGYFILYTPAGQPAMQVQLPKGGKLSLKAYHLPAGLYFYRFTTQTGSTESGKLLIQH